MEAILFWIFSIGMLIAGLSVIINRSPVASALSLAVVILFMAGLFVLLHSYFLAAIQVVVYAGAVMVLFLFIIMLLDLKEAEKRPLRLISFLFGLVVAGGFFVQVMRVIKRLPAPLSLSGTVLSPIGDDAVAIGNQLFTKYLLPFEVTSLLLLVATVGVILLSKREIK